MRDAESEFEKFFRMEGRNLVCLLHCKPNCETCVNVFLRIVTHTQSADRARMKLSTDQPPTSAREPGAAPCHLRSGRRRNRPLCARHPEPPPASIPTFR